MPWWGLVMHRKPVGSLSSSRLGSRSKNKTPSWSTTATICSGSRHRYRICFFLIGLLLIGMMILQWKSSSSSSWFSFRTATVFANVDEEQRNKYQQQQQQQLQQPHLQAATVTVTTATHQQQVDVPQRQDLEQGKTTLTLPTATATTTTYQRAIFLISMGKDAAESAIVERCLLSIRRRGQWNGPVVVLTDAPPERYQFLIPVMENSSPQPQPPPLPLPLTIVLRPQPDHYNWNTLKDDMPYKRFKTFVLEYMDRDSRLDAIELVYYLDVDIVVSAPLQTFFQYTETTYQIPLGRSTSQRQQIQQIQQEQSPLHRLYLYKGNYPLPVQSGQLIMERYHTRNCLERWRSWLDKDHDLILDQLALRNLLNETTMENDKNDNSNNNNKKRCQIVLMEQEPHLHFPTKQTMVQMSSSSGSSTTSSSSSTKNEPPLSLLPTLIHIKNSKTAGQIQWSVQKKFFRHILQLSPLEESEGVLFGPTTSAGSSSSTQTVNNNGNNVTSTTMPGGERRIKVARPMIILPSKAWSQQQEGRGGKEQPI